MKLPPLILWMILDKTTFSKCGFARHRQHGYRRKGRCGRSKQSSLDSAQRNNDKTTTKILHTQSHVEHNTRYRGTQVITVNKSNSEERLVDINLGPVRYSVWWPNGPNPRLLTLVCGHLCKTPRAGQSSIPAADSLSTRSLILRKEAERAKKKKKKRIRNASSFHSAPRSEIVLTQASSRLIMAERRLNNLVN